MVPKLREANLEERYAVLGAAAVHSLFRVPLGWHVLDDAKRTLVYDTEGRIQINLSLLHCQPENHGQVLAQIEENLRTPGQDFASKRLELGGMQTLAIRALRSGREVLDQVYMVRKTDREDFVLVGRVTAKAEDIVFALNAAEVVMTSLACHLPVGTS